MSSRRVGLCVVSFAGWLLACGADEAPRAEHVDAAVPAPPQMHDHDAGKVPEQVDAASVSTDNLDSAFELPDNSSFDTARAVPVGMDTMQRVVNEVQVDYYSFEARAGVFYVLYTDESSFSPNNVISVFDPDHTMIAENDAGSLYPNDHIDARLIVRPERSGTHYVTVEDRVNKGAELGRFTPPLFYRLSLREITADTEGYALETDGQQARALTLLQDPKSQTRYVTVLGTLSDDNKTETYDLQGATDFALIGQLLTAGGHGDGSTAATVSVRVTADSDGHLLASCALASAQTNIHPPVDDAKYHIQISAGDQIGANGFYALDLALLPDNPHERTEVENNSVGAAEPITLTARRGLLLSRLPAKDIDHYRFSAEPGDRAYVLCEGESGGSGVRGLQAELLSPMMQPLMAAREAATKPLVIEPFELTQSGTYYLKLSSETPDNKDAVEPWARCAVRLGR